MRRVLITSVFLLFTVLATAQEYVPKVELGLGYSYSYMRVPNTSTRVNMNGLVFSGTFNVNRWTGLEAEFGTHYHCISGCWIYGIRVDNPDETNDSVSFLIGPRVNLAPNRRVQPWIHALAGVTRTAYSNHIAGYKVSTSGFGWAAGGGLDVPYHAVTIRAIQVDFTRYAAEPEDFNNVRIGAGIVFRIGRREIR